MTVLNSYNRLGNHTDSESNPALPAAKKAQYSHKCSFTRAMIGISSIHMSLRANDLSATFSHVAKLG